MTQSPPIVIVFAASDPTGGAGIQADLLTLAALGCHPCTVVTALTAQDTHGVRSLRPVDADFVVAQARALLEEMPVAAFKLGALATRANVLAIARLLAEQPGTPVVIDPVLASERGDALAEDGAIEALRSELLPQATVLTPNSPEARRLAKRDGHAPLADCARELTRQGARFVLITGTHEDTPDVVNTLYDADGVIRADRWPRLPERYHGSGCTLASALAAQLAQGRDAPTAARAAQEYTWRALQRAYRPAAGQWIPRRLHDQRAALR